MNWRMFLITTDGSFSRDSSVHCMNLPKDLQNEKQKIDESFRDYLKKLEQNLLKTCG